MFTNLLWALRDRSIPHYRAAIAIGMSESRFSRALRGLAAFTTEEQSKMAALVGYPESWLFAKVRPPRTQAFDTNHPTRGTTAKNKRKNPPTDVSEA